MKTILTIENVKEVALNYAKVGPEALSKKFGVSRQRVEQIAVKLRRLGVAIPRIRIEQRDMKAIAEQLIAEHPELRAKD